MDYMQQETCLFISTNVTPQKRNGRNCVLNFFHRDWRRCTKSYPRMVKAISLGMWTSPLNPKHSRFVHVQLLFFYRCTLSHKLGASFFLVLLWFLFCEITTLSFIYGYATGIMGWNILHAIIELGKGMYKLIFNDTYNCMIHELLYE